MAQIDLNEKVNGVKMCTWLLLWLVRKTRGHSAIVTKSNHTLGTQSNVELFWRLTWCFRLCNGFAVYYYFIYFSVVFFFTFFVWFSFYTDLIQLAQWIYPIWWFRCWHFCFASFYSLTTNILSSKFIGNNNI